ncbi:MAG TPA: DEAD/DEAH box helicase, partial [Campylobacterales bacterium]|nr:DEAD/DEAH box helicase [Campylobacterales bacterium]
MSLGSLGLSPQIVKAIQVKGYREATPIQEALIPAILKGQDILAGAQTGTGKTAGFALPILHDLAEEKRVTHRLRAVVIVPTRELANQVFQSFQDYGKYLSLKTVVLYGGANMTAQRNRLEAGCDIIVATPGRLMEHLERKHLNAERLRYLVFDEADTILELGFLNEVRRVIDFLPTKRQNILISATLSGSVKRLANETLHKPKLIEIDSMGSLSKNVELVVYPVEKERKMELLSYVIGSRNYQKVLVFVRKKEEADEVVTELKLSGLKSMVIHGDKTS